MEKFLHLIKPIKDHAMACISRIERAKAAKANSLLAEMLPLKEEKQTRGDSATQPMEC